MQFTLSNVTYLGVADMRQHRVSLLSKIPILEKMQGLVQNLGIVHHECMRDGQNDVIFHSHNFCSLNRYLSVIGACDQI